MAVHIEADLSGLTNLKSMPVALGRGSDGFFRPAYIAAGVTMESFLQRHFKAKSLPKSTSWQPISPITLILRRRVGKKIRSMKEAEKIALTRKTLSDTGVLRASIFGGAGHVNIAKGMFVEVGTNLKKAELHQQTPSETQRKTKFQFGAKEEARFEKNFAKILPGSKPPRTPTGRRSRAKKNWNREFFIMRARLNKMDGQKFNVPKREIIPTDRKTLEPFASKLGRVFDAAVQAVINQKDA